MTEQEIDVVKNQMTNLRDQLTATFEVGTNKIQAMYKRSTRILLGVFVLLLLLQHIALSFVYTCKL